MRQRTLAASTPAFGLGLAISLAWSVLGRRWTIGGVVLGTLETALGGLLTLGSEIDPDVLWPVAAAWGVASGTLLVVEGLRLRRLARTFRR